MNHYRSKKPEHLLTRILFLAGLFFISCKPVIGATDSQSARKMLEGIRNQHRAQTVISRYRVTITRPQWQRTIILDVYEDQITSRYEARLLAPAKLRDTLYMKDSSHIWMYLPKLKRRVQISQAMMLEPWMGSDLINQDLLQADSIIDLYQHRIVAREHSSDHDIITIESTPETDAPVVWGKMIQVIRSDNAPIRVEFYDRKERLVRRIEFSDFQTLNGRMLPMRWLITPMPDSGRSTELIVEHTDFDVPLPEDVFTHLPEKTSP